MESSTARSPSSPERPAARAAATRCGWRRRARTRRPRAPSGAGARLILVDLAGRIGSVPYPMSTPEDLAETVSQIEALDRRVVSVLADARIAPQGTKTDDRIAFAEVVGVNLTGVFNIVIAAVPSMIEKGAGGAIVLTGSTQGLSGADGDGTGATSGYAAAEQGVVGLMRSFANRLSPKSIRVNTVHPTGVNTPMVVNDAMQAFLTANPEMGSAMQNLMPVELVQPIDISNAIAWLVSDEARYVTGVTLPVDAGFLVK